MKTVNVRNKATGEQKVAVYGPTPSGHMRYHVDGKPISDKKFDDLYAIESASLLTDKNRGLGMHDHSNVSDNGYEDY